MVCKPYQTQTVKFYRTYKPRISKTSRSWTERLEDVKISIFSNSKHELNVFPVKVSTEFLFGKINVQEKPGGRGDEAFDLRCQMHYGKEWHRDTNALVSVNTQKRKNKETSQSQSDSDIHTVSGISNITNEVTAF